MPNAVDTQLKSLREALQAKTAENDAIISAVEVDGDTTIVSPEQAETFRKNLAEANEIKGQMELLEGQSALHVFLDSPEDASLAAKAAAAGHMGNRVVRKTLGELFTGSDEFKMFRKQGGYTMPQPWEVEGVDLGSAWTPRAAGEAAAGVKDLYGSVMTPNADIPFGLLPVQADNQIIPLGQRTTRIRDLFNVQRTQAAVIEFFRVTGFTNNASVVPDREGSLYGLKPHSSLTFTGTTAPVRTIAHWETAHRNALDDIAQLQGIVNNELLYGLRLAEDAQILNGTGTGEDILGVLNTPGIQGHTRAAGDNYADAIRRAMTKAFLSYYEPTGVVVHPVDWEGIELLKSTTGQYLLATNVAIGAVKQVWRLPVVDTPAMAEGTALVGAFGIGATLYDRMAGNIRIAEQHADLFVRNAVVILAEERVALAVKRPESFVKITL